MYCTFPKAGSQEPDAFVIEYMRRQICLSLFKPYTIPLSVIALPDTPSYVPSLVFKAELKYLFKKEISSVCWKREGPPCYTEGTEDSRGQEDRENGQPA